MNKITELTSKAIALKTPKDKRLHAFSLIQIEGMRWVHFLDKDNNDIEHAIELPPGSWSILGRPEELTSNQWYGIVPGDYPKKKGIELLKSKSMEGESIIILIKQ